MSTLSAAIRVPFKAAKRAVPKPIRNILLTSVDAIRTKAYGLPPRQLREWISPLWFDYHKTGRDQLEFFIELAGLNRSDRFLDIACGVGRIATPLLNYLDDKGRYEGFDIKDELIHWCNSNLASRRANFGFKIADVATSWSLGRGASVSQYKFPYDDRYFDFAYAGSIFTHILPDGAANYLKQTARVLRPGGKFVSTWLVYNSNTASKTSTNNSLERHWPFDYGDHRVMMKDIPEASVAFDEAKIRAMYAEAGLEILEPFRPDASYSSVRIPENRQVGMHLYHSLCIIARRIDSN